MKKYRGLWLSLVVVVLLTTACGKKEEEVEEEILKPVVVEKAQTRANSRDLEISGNVKPKQLVKVAFKVPGTLEAMHVDEGSVVSKGQTLMSINSHDFEIGLNSARAQRDTVQLELDSKLRSAEEQAKSSLDFVNEQLEKVRRLVEKGAVAQKTLDELEVQQVVAENKYQEVLDARETAKSQLAQAQSLVDLAESKMADTVVTSPVSGTVIKKRAEEGETVIPGNPALVIADLSHLEVEMGVPDRHIGSIKVGQNVKVELKSLDRTVDGKVEFIDSAADQETRTFGVKVGIANPEGDIKPGMIGTVKVNLGNVSNITIPADAIIDDAEGTSIFIYDEEEKTVSRRDIKTGEIYVDEIEVLEGLADGEMVVIEGHYRLNDGEEVSVRRVEEDD